MRKIGRLIASFSLALLVLLGVSDRAEAAGQVTYQGGAEKFLLGPGSSYSATDLFDWFKDVMPGDRRTGEITVKNTGKTSVKLYLRGLGAGEDSRRLLEQMTLTVQNQAGTVLSSAGADQAGGLAQWVELGTFAPGSSTALTVTLEVPLSMDNRSAGQAGYLDWQFRAEEQPQEDAPATGDRGAVLYGLLLPVAAGGALAAWKGSRRKRP